MSNKILVLGCGVIGLTTALRLQENGSQVEIWTKEELLETTSATAAAFWYPYLIEPIEKALTWGEKSYQIFAEQESEKTSGIIKTPLLSYFETDTQRPVWADALPSFNRIPESELPSQYKDGFSLDSYMVEMPIYLEYLREKFESQGGVINMREVRHLDEVFKSHDIVINCMGAGSREIVDDHSPVHAIRGQVALVESHEQDNTIIFDTKNCLYVVPRSDGTILGGTAEKHVYNRTPNVETTKKIMDRCAEFVPEIDKRQILWSKVGLRPGREAVRLEKENIDNDKVLIHNYGHGGAGVTVCWGCADEVVEILKD